MINKLEWDPDNLGCLLTISSDNQMKLFDKDLNDVVMIFKNKSGGYLDAKFAKWDHKILAAAKDNGEIEIWDTRNPANPVTQQRIHMSSISACDWNPYIRHILLTGSTDKHIKINNFSNPSSTEQIFDMGTYAGIGVVRWKDDSKYEFSACFSQNNETDLFQYHMLMPSFPIYMYKGHTDVIIDFAWLKNSQYLLTCGKNSLLNLKHKSFNYCPALDMNVSGISYIPGNSFAYTNAKFYPKVFFSFKME